MKTEKKREKKKEKIGENEKKYLDKYFNIWLYIRLEFWLRRVDSEQSLQFDLDSLDWSLSGNRTSL